MSDSEVSEPITVVPQEGAIEWQINTDGFSNKNPANAKTDKQRTIS